MKCVLLSNLLFLFSFSLFAQVPSQEVELDFIKQMNLQILNVDPYTVTLEMTVTVGELPSEGELLIYVDKQSLAQAAKVTSGETVTLPFIINRKLGPQADNIENYYVACKVVSGNQSETDGCIVTIGG